jgi:hypothetical protein
MLKNNFLSVLKTFYKKAQAKVYINFFTLKSSFDGDKNKTNHCNLKLICKILYKIDISQRASSHTEGDGIFILILNRFNKKSCFFYGLKCISLFQ